MNVKDLLAPAALGVAPRARVRSVPDLLAWCDQARPFKLRIAQECSAHIRSLGLFKSIHYSEQGNCKRSKCILSHAPEAKQPLTHEIPIFAPAADSSRNYSRLLFPGDQPLRAQRRGRSQRRIQVNWLRYDRVHITSFAARHACWLNSLRITRTNSTLNTRLGKVRLAKWFTTLPPKTKAKIVKDVTQLVLARRTRMCNFLEYKGCSLSASSKSSAIMLIQEIVT